MLYYLHNEHSDITGIIDNDCYIKNTYDYDVFGNIVNTEENIDNEFTYYEQQFDKITQLYYLRARYYNAEHGRFIQEDVYRDDGLNLYAYVKNNPVMWIDPNGYNADATNTLYINQIEKNENFVKGVGLSSSASGMININMSKMIYWDGDGNFALMDTVGLGGEIDVQISRSINHEISSNAENVMDMTGNSFVGGGSVGPKILGKANVGYSHTSNGEVTSHTGSVSLGLTAVPASI